MHYADGATLGKHVRILILYTELSKPHLGTISYARIEVLRKAETGILHYQMAGARTQAFLPISCVSAILYPRLAKNRCRDASAKKNVKWSLPRRARANSKTTFAGVNCFVLCSNIDSTQYRISSHQGIYFENTPISACDREQEQIPAETRVFLSVPRWTTFNCFLSCAVLVFGPFEFAGIGAS
eukprot:5992-Rhodomonas_salina.1